MYGLNQLHKPLNIPITFIIFQLFHYHVFQHNGNMSRVWVFSFNYFKQILKENGDAFSLCTNKHPMLQS